MTSAAVVLLLASALPACPQVRYPPRPAAREFIVDEAGLLKPDDAAEIRRLCDQVLTDKRAPIIVVTLRSLADYGASGWPVERYAMNLFSEWGVGWPEWNYGMLLLVSTGDRKARIELGAGWAHRKDADAQRIMNELVIPGFKRGDFSGGIREGVKGLHALALGLSVPRGSLRDRSSGSAGAVFWIVLAVAALSLFSGGLRGGGGCSPFGMGCLGGLFGSWFGNTLWGSSSSGGGWGGSWGGGSFGGGFSGGGGASGSW
jgi:uncharacterized protein